MLGHRWITRGAGSAAGALVALALAGCAMMEGMQSAGTTIQPPQHAALSPDYAPEQITKVAVFPLFASGTANDVVAERLVGAIGAEMASRQPQWSVVPNQEVQRLISQHGLLGGYRNLEADHNAFSLARGAVALSMPSRAFLQKFAEVSGVDAVLVGSYQLDVRTEPVRNPQGQIIGQQQHEVSTVNLGLVHLPSARSWWVASAARHGPRDAVAQAIAQTLATHVGKGTLQHMM